MKKQLLLALSLCLTVSTALSRELVLGVGNFPPYFDVKGTSGLFNDIIRETFKLLPEYSVTLDATMTNYRLVAQLNKGAVDGAANVFADAKSEGCRSDPVFRFTDVVVSRKEQNLSINGIDDLKGLRIVTYQGARTFLGPKFTSIIDSRPQYYREIPQPMEQASLLAQGQADVSIGDMYIFLNAIKTMPGGKLSSQDFVIHRLFPDIYSHMAFRDQKLCDQFNSALRKLKKSGKYEEIYAHHLQSLK